MGLPCFGFVRELRFALLAIVACSGALAAQHELDVEGVSPDAPFTVRAWADASRLVVDLELAKGWHAYARDVGGGEPISLELAKDSAYQAVGKLRLPSDEKGKLRGRVRIEQWIKATGRSQNIAAKLNFMVCDPLQCLPPIELALSGKVKPLRVLLAVSSKDDFATRVAGFLEKRGFVVSSTTYDEVDVKTCDTHDVVLAASKLFRQDGKGGRKASSFPKTKTPIVAVGFLGTRLIENHGLAMTSGYI